MKSLHGLNRTATLLVGGGVLAYAQRPRPSGPRDSPIERVDWVAGCFETRTGNRVVEEIRMGDRVTLAAPEPDYPQIVGYAKAGKDSVVAWIDGIAGGKRKRVGFPYKRVPCPR